MTLKEFSIDLAEAPADIQDDIDQVEAAEKALLAKVDERFPDEGFQATDGDGNRLPDAEVFEEKFYELREQRAELEARKRRIEEFVTDPDQAGGWSDHEFVFREPSTEDGLYIRGRSSALAEEAEKRGENIDERMFGVTQFLDRVLVDAPAEAPDNLAGTLPQKIGDWLLDELDELATGGAVGDLGNSSPQEALRDFQNSQRSSSEQDTTSENSRSRKPSTTENTTTT